MIDSIEYTYLEKYIDMRFQTNTTMRIFFPKVI
jgi:hypothetical protein